MTALCHWSHLQIVGNTESWVNILFKDVQTNRVNTVTEINSVCKELDASVDILNNSILVVNKVVIDQGTITNLLESCSHNSNKDDLVKEDSRVIITSKEKVEFSPSFIICLDGHWQIVLASHEQFQKKKKKKVLRNLKFNQKTGNNIEKTLTSIV